MSDAPTNIPTLADISLLCSFDWRNHWLTPAEYAVQTRRPLFTVYRWCKDGTLDSFHVPHIRDGRGRHWIKNVR